MSQLTIISTENYLWWPLHVAETVILESDDIAKMNVGIRELFQLYISAHSTLTFFTLLFPWRSSEPEFLTKVQSRHLAGGVCGPRTRAPSPAFSEVSHYNYSITRAGFSERISKILHEVSYCILPPNIFDEFTFQYYILGGKIYTY